MNSLSSFLLVVCLLILAAGCGVVPRSGRPPAESTGNPAPGSGDSADAAPRAMKVSSVKEIQASLMQAYREWKGTPYVLGGESKSGVDCSRFLQIVFDDYFGIELPNNTREQLNTGEGIRRAGIRAGDLVFFKTGRKTLHVGVAVNGGEFLHASTSSGVRISKLGRSYWRNRFLAARRVF